MLITYYEIYMGDCLAMSFIIRTFVLSVVNTDDGFGGMSFAEGGLQPTYIIYKHKKIPHHK
jgi:hypothetical protein